MPIVFRRKGLGVGPMYYCWRNSLILFAGLIALMFWGLPSAAQDTPTWRQPCNGDIDCSPPIRGRILERCIEGICQGNRMVLCTSDAHCPRGQICAGPFTCSEPEPQCTQDSDCPAGQICRRHQCRQLHPIVTPPVSGEPRPRPAPGQLPTPVPIPLPPTTGEPRPTPAPGSR